MGESEVDKINKQIFGDSKEYNLIDVYHYLMVSYGYIPFDDFTNMDADLVNELVVRINKMNEKSNQAGRRGKF